MTPEKILEIISLYRRLFEERNIGKAEYPLDAELGFDDKMHALEHCHYMLGQMVEHVDEGQVEKASRWIGFIQGVLWDQGMYTIADMADHNRPAYDIDKVALLHIKDGKLLFGRTRGLAIWYNLGGKRQQMAARKETDVEVLVREIREECGVEILSKTARRLKVFFGEHEGKSMRMACFSAEFVGELTPSGEVEEFAWFTSADAGRTTPMGRIVLGWLKTNALID